MSEILIVLSVWLHALATVVFVGHYVLLAWVSLPALTAARHATALSAISKRSRAWLYGSLAVFAVTGVYLTFIDPNYLGIGNFTNLWALLMLVKHLLLLVMVALGFWYNAILRVGPMLMSNHPEQALMRFRNHVNAMAICGALVLLLTAIAQLQ